LIFGIVIKQFSDRALSMKLGALLLLISAASTASGSTLAHELFEEENWNACRIECARYLQSKPDAEIHLLHAICGLRLGLDTTDTLHTLCEDGTTPPHIQAWAHYELGRALWVSGETANAFAHLKQSFLTADDIKLHQRAGCTLNFVVQEKPALLKTTPGLESLLLTSKKMWDRDLRRECQRPAKQKKRVLTAPARGMITLYQAQIAPAIGSRCSLHPSCSHYASEALQKHGVVGLGAIGDRFIREPSVVSAKNRPIMINGHGKYADPLSDHDNWMKP
jgi:putative component of membrane protein insertase Oxa1/YidC/SpoIIIJ protein YidD